MRQLKISVAILFSILPGLLITLCFDQVAAGTVPLVSNAGQAPDEVAFHGRPFWGDLFVTRKGSLVYSVPKNEGGGYAFEETFSQTLEPAVMGGEPSSTRVSCFKGGWSGTLPAFLSVDLKGIYEGIDLQVHIRGDNMEKLFTIHPGASPRDIQVQVRGAMNLKRSEAGELEVITGSGKVSFTRPLAYQVIGEERREVAVAYTISEDRYGFFVGDYDEDHDLVIDPLLASTFLGGTLKDRALAMQRDDLGRVFVTGFTKSVDFPVTVGAWDESPNGDFDVFVARFSEDLSGLEACTFLGGSGKEEANALALDGAGSLYVAGNTGSADFPATPGAYDESFNGTSPGPYDSPGDIFVCKLNLDLTTLEASTFLGGSKHEYNRTLCLDGSGGVFVSGSTASSDFPATPGAYNEVHHTTGTWKEDVVVARFNADLTSLVAATYLGGSKDEFVEAMGLADDGSVFVAGWTASTDYPVTAGAFDEDYNGYQYDAFVTKLPPDLSALSASSYLGGSSWDFVYTLLMDPSGDLFLAGHTASLDFPTTPGAYDTTYNSAGGPGVGDDIFITRMDGDLSSVQASTYLGGSGWEHSTALVLNGEGSLYCAGSTSSTDFPATPGAYDTVYGGGSAYNGDNYIARLDDGLTTLEAATYLGGNDEEYYKTSLACPPGGGRIWIAASTLSTDFPVKTGAFDVSQNGAYDVYVAVLDDELLHDPLEPVLDLLVDGQQGPVSVPHTQSVRLTLSLDPRDFEGQPMDWWVVALWKGQYLLWWAYPATWSLVPMVAHQGPLFDLDERIFFEGALPPGTWQFGFAVDAMNGVIEGTYMDMLEVNSQ